MEVSEVLNKAADLLEKSGAWTQGCFATDVTGEAHLYGWEIGATCFCAVGAIQHIAGSDAYFEGRHLPAVEALEKVVGWVPDFNDAPNRTQAEVVEALRQAARQSEGVREMAKTDEMPSRPDPLAAAVAALKSARADLLRFACARGSEWEGSLAELTAEIDQALRQIGEGK